ncbi:hypothetical protein Tco_0908742 [Tanacetum coccineum]|uniref:Uncharacterized protein n=1 Tax=Tanacetum coccineum TaxID=301880 RepID=A0ABQ5CPX4_9ASTR
MAVEIPQTLEYKGGQLNAAPMLEVENFTNWKKRFMCHIVGIEPQFKKIITDGPYVPMTASGLHDQMNSVINCENAKLTWEDLDFQDSPDDEEDTRSSEEYMNDLEMKFHERDLLEKSKSATNVVELVTLPKIVSPKLPLLQSPFQNRNRPKFVTSSQEHKPELRPQKDFEEKYNKIKAKLALLSSCASSSKSAQVRNQGLVAEAYEWDEEDLSSDDN